MSFYSQFAEYYEAVFPFREEIAGFLRSHLLPGPRRILDAGCGTGHYCGRLAADGHEVVGVDLDPQMIEVARRQYPAVTFRCLNVLEIGDLTPPFDLIFCIGNVAPHLTQDEFARFLDLVVRLLRPGGHWLFQVVNWDAILDRDSHTFRVRTLGGGSATFHRRYAQISEERVRFLTRLVAEERPLFEGDVWLYPIRSETVRRLHRERGLDPVGHFADFQRTPFDPTSVDSGSVFVFRKP
jgi:SAM-dependent methyltransferase